jgi:hypothetical protein
MVQNRCNIMGKPTTPAEDWPLGTLLWFAVVVWFSSSLLSQSAFMAIHGLPYDAVAMLKTLGPVYYVVVVLELGMWLAVLGYGGHRWMNRRRERQLAL